MLNNVTRDIAQHGPRPSDSAGPTPARGRSPAAACGGDVVGIAGHGWGLDRRPDRHSTATADRGIICVVNHDRVTLRELTDESRDDVLALRVADGQERFVGSVAGALEDAEAYPHAKPWYRAIYAGA